MGESAEAPAKGLFGFLPELSILLSRRITALSLKFPFDPASFFDPSVSVSPYGISDEFRLARPLVNVLHYIIDILS